jgi:histidyl-tRNA synthetase
MDHERTKKMQKANKLRVKYSVLFGDEELNDNIYILKNMLTGDEKKLRIEELINFLKEITL